MRVRGLAALLALALPALAACDGAAGPPPVEPPPITPPPAPVDPFAAYPGRYAVSETCTPASESRGSYTVTLRKGPESQTLELVDYGPYGTLTATWADTAFVFRADIGSTHSMRGALTLPAPNTLRLRHTVNWVDVYNGTSGTTRCVSTGPRQG